MLKVELVELHLLTITISVGDKAVQNYLSVFRHLQLRNRARPYHHWLLNLSSLPLHLLLDLHVDIVNATTLFNIVQDLLLDR